MQTSPSLRSATRFAPPLSRSISPTPHFKNFPPPGSSPARVTTILVPLLCSPRASAPACSRPLPRNPLLPRPHKSLPFLIRSSTSPGDLPPAAPRRLRERPLAL